MPNFEYASPELVHISKWLGSRHLGLTANERIELNRSLSGLLLSPVPIVEYASNWRSNERTRIEDKDVGGSPRKRVRGDHTNYIYDLFNQMHINALYIQTINY
ncbi:hypothetical protein V1515DRAFT_584048 [Lipomyces mesembrius]